MEGRDFFSCLLRQVISREETTSNNSWAPIEDNASVFHEVEHLGGEAGSVGSDDTRFGTADFERPVRCLSMLARGQLCVHIGDGDSLRSSFKVLYIAVCNCLWPSEESIRPESEGLQKLVLGMEEEMRVL